MSLIIRCNLNSKNRPMKHFPRSASPSMSYRLEFFGYDRHVKGGGKKTDADISFQQDFLGKNALGKRYFLFQLHKTVIGDLMRKKVLQMFADILLVIMLEAVNATGMKQDKNNRNLSIAHAVRLITMFTLLIFNHIFFLL